MSPGTAPSQRTPEVWQRRTLRETSLLVREVRANPKKYFNFSLF